MLGTLWIRLPGNDTFATLTLPAVIVRSEGATPTAWLDAVLSTAEPREQELHRHFLRVVRQEAR